MKEHPESGLPPAPPPEDIHTSPARELSLHMLRMLETRMDAAGIALQGETQILMSRLQLKLLAAAAVFVAIWGGIVLLAIGLPPDWRIPVLSLVVLSFVGVAVAAHVLARRKASSHEVGSLRWFLDSLRQDLEVLSRGLAGAPPSRVSPKTQPPEPPSAERSTPSDIAA
jgi:uncharacterized membrane protein YqjE